LGGGKDAADGGMRWGWGWAWRSRSRRGWPCLFPPLAPPPVSLLPLKPFQPRQEVGPPPPVSLRAAPFSAYTRIWVDCCRSRDSLCWSRDSLCRRRRTKTPFPADEPFRPNGHYTTNARRLSLARDYPSGSPQWTCWRRPGSLETAVLSHPSTCN
jgi:hypothetical protein